MSTERQWINHGIPASYKHGVPDKHGVTDKHGVPDKLGVPNVHETEYLIIIMEYLTRI